MPSNDIVILKYLGNNTFQTPEGENKLFSMMGYVSLQKEKTYFAEILKNTNIINKVVEI